MKILAGLVVSTMTATMSQGLPQPSAQIDSWHTVQRVCGVIEHISYLSQKHSAQRLQKSQPFRHLHLKLYEALGGTTCCDTLPLEGQAVTDDDGKYNFRKIVPGAYWLAFDFDGRTYSYPLRYEPMKHADSDCDGFYLGFDEHAEPALRREVVVE
jgi:hypothetical protein